MTQGSTSDAVASSWTGGCQCGAVRYRLLMPPLEANVCHCRMCQKASGGPVMAFARVRKTDLEWTRGAPGTFRSSSLVERNFCTACGTPLTYNPIEGRHVSVTACSLDDPSALTPTKRYGVECTLPWFSAIETLPGVTIDQFMTPERAARFVNHQHPDHE